MGKKLPGITTFVFPLTRFHEKVWLPAHLLHPGGRLLPPDGGLHGRLPRTGTGHGLRTDGKRRDEGGIVLAWDTD